MGVSVDNFLEYPIQSGFLVFVIGGLALLALYHLFLYFQNRDSLYLIYSVYITFMILSQNRQITDGFVNSAFNLLGGLRNFFTFYTEAYYIIYFFFAFKFLSIKKDFPRGYKFIRYSLYVLMAYCLVQLLIFIRTGDMTLNLNLYYIFVGLILILSVFLYVLIFRSKRPLRNYLITGSFLLLIFSVWSLVVYLRLVNSGKPTEASFSLLYIGFIAENVVFALSLGKKQRLVMEERNVAQEKLIVQLKENERLENKQRKKLQEDVELLHAKVERDQLERLTIQYEKDMAELKLASLRGQMNPHFIFNALNSIKSFIIENHQEKAVYYLNKFSKLVRLILSSSMEKNISLHDEIEITKLYVQIEKIRFDDDQFQFDISIDDHITMQTTKVPALIFQPFLENAIWHGLSSKKGLKELSMDITLEDDHVIVSIYDNGIGRKQAAAIKERKVLKRKSYGIALSEERLRNFVHGTSEECNIQIIDCTDEEGNSTGTRILITLPVSTTQKPTS
ncbi:MAG: hypothetical protein DWP94_02840 [Flavobacterium sp.]|nr:MAG: hypothetical protein DWP94_02840 [Flavobacterium sp.]